MKKVLIIEDLEQYQQAYTEALADKVEIIPARTLAEAFTALEQYSDLAAIVVDGCVDSVTIDSLPFVRQACQTFSGPIIAASATPHYRDLLVEAGCNYTAPKEDVPQLLTGILNV